MKECRYTVCRPVQTTSIQDGHRDLLPDRHRDRLPRGLRDGLRAPDGHASRSPASAASGSTSRYCVPGKTVCINGCLYQCPADLRAASRSGARGPSSRTSAARSTSAGDPQAGAVHRLQAGARTASPSRSPSRPARWSPRSASSRSRSPPAGWSTRPASSRSP